MKTLFVVLCALLSLIVGYGQSTKVEEEETEKSCQEFDPTIWEDPSREPLRSGIAELMPGLSGSTIVDIGAGAGYFAFEYAESAKKVIATELDLRLIEYMTNKKERLGLDNISIKIAHSDQSEFKKTSIDYALMVNVYHELNDPKIFLPRLKANMNTGGKIIIVESHISPVIVTDYLENAGFTDVEVIPFVYNSSCGPTEVSIITARNNLNLKG